MLKLSLMWHFQCYDVVVKIIRFWVVWVELYYNYTKLLYTTWFGVVLGLLGFENKWLVSSCLAACQPGWVFFFCLYNIHQGSRSFLVLILHFVRLPPFISPSGPRLTLLFVSGRLKRVVVSTRSKSTLILCIRCHLVLTESTLRVAPLISGSTSGPSVMVQSSNSTEGLVGYSRCAGTRMAAN